MSDTAKKPVKRAPRKKAAAAVPASAPETVRNAPIFNVDFDVRWRDLDAFNHVNNSTYLTYLEEARLGWLRTVQGSWFNEHAMPVLAAVRLDYRRPIEWPARITVMLTLERIGTSSITLGHRIVDAARAELLYCDGNAVMVWVDPAGGASVPLPEAIRAALASVPSSDVHAESP